ncbi:MULTISPECIES: chromosome partitioning protein ParA [Marinobacter]|uniref:chromosome partitioning protein ParA n=1 Tax=Marinobacter TaxID=2742 RepID=UPI003B42C613|nr:chromosome partitioning protein ParA [Marinobacter alkaliphilus]
MTAKADDKTNEATAPLLWIEKVWLLDSLDTLIPIREIPLKRGLNLVLSEPGESNSGHGVGKTAFCQLLRFVLDDPHWDRGTPLREELRYAMPDGAVSAVVHVGNECWTVLKPWKHQKHYRASKSGNWQQLAQNEVTNEYAQYQGAIERQLVNRLPVKSFPESNQTIKWHQVLAWLTRDQGSRYQSYYHWRKEGTGFSLPAQSPALLVRIILGLLNDASVHRQLSSCKQEVKSLEKQVADLERRPRDLMDHVKHQLSQAMGVEQGSPFFSENLLEPDSLSKLATQRISKCRSDLEYSRSQQKKQDDRRLEILSQTVKDRDSCRWLNNEIARIDATIEGNVQEIERLQREPDALQSRLHQYCDHAGLLLADCSHVCDRINSISIDSTRTRKLRKEEVDRLQERRQQCEKRLTQLQQNLNPYETELASIALKIQELYDQQLEQLSFQRQLEEAVKNYEFYSGIAANPNQWETLKSVREQRTAASQEADRLAIQIQQENDRYSNRRKLINDQMHNFAQFLGEDAWGAFDEDKFDNHPFRIGPVHSVTFGVIETLAGDIVCLLDSINSGSHHPGFLLHDSPREAEMSERLFWAMLGQIAPQENPGFQYIITTSTRAPEQFRSAIRLRLSGHTEKEYLFKRKIGAEQRPLS